MQHLTKLRVRCAFVVSLGAEPRRASFAFYKHCNAAVPRPRAQNVDTRAGAALYALEQGLVQHGPAVA